eukprot:CAMPEP_0113938380 /NCGR_PEP_ID=MMETSP1339-20121228/4820_1 /TAXON_ID=94617 /ORGANISM="Fibrocapsa japonica" /LENGTH=642 /DNA_ID=CAMNT_0000941475 /DNA_START=36 /DNA_END=1964 /DNA_ORIENTATION=- /assembly_acc=CAM_ASM_000762
MEVNPRSNQGYGTLERIGYRIGASVDTRVSRAQKIFVGFASVAVVMAVIVGTASVVKNSAMENYNSLYSVNERGLAYVTDDSVVYSFGTETPEDTPPELNRFPKDPKKISVDLFSHPKVVETMESLLDESNEFYDPDLHDACNGPDNNIDIYLNEDQMRADLWYSDAYSAFGLDCRLPNTNHIAFLVVMGAMGDIINIRRIERRAESVNLYNTSTILASTQRGVYLWNYITDTYERTKFSADTHTLIYRQSENRFYGCYPDKKAIELHEPNTVCSFDGVSGKTVFDDKLQKTKGWAWSDASAHMNYITLGGDSAYVSERQNSALKKVNMDTNEVEWVLGGRENTFDITIYDGSSVDITFRGGAQGTSQPWNHQHKFQHLDDQYVSLFDNNVDNDHTFIEKSWGKDSRMVVLHIDQENQKAEEVFSWPTGDRARSYGGTDILPSGNLLGSSYVDWVFPAMEDYQYHQNIWEVNTAGEVVWRVGFKGLNIVAPEDVTDPYPHHFRKAGDSLSDVMPVGWNIYNVERVYPLPVVSQPCAIRSEGQPDQLQFMPFNTLRSQEDYPGAAFVAPSGTVDYVGSTTFMFHKSWLPRLVIMDIDTPADDPELTLSVGNHWDEFAVIEIGKMSELADCPAEDQFRSFFPIS